MPNIIKIISDGTTIGTKLYFDDVEVKDLKGFTFGISVDDILATIFVEHAITGVPDVHKNGDNILEAQEKSIQTAVQRAIEFGRKTKLGNLVQKPKKTTKKRKGE